jgi:hypothetical protein
MIAAFYRRWCQQARYPPLDGDAWHAAVRGRVGGPRHRRCRAARQLAAETSTRGPLPGLTRDCDGSRAARRRDPAYGLEHLRLTRTIRSWLRANSRWFFCFYRWRLAARGDPRRWPAGLFGRPRHGKWRSEPGGTSDGRRAPPTVHENPPAPPPAVHENAPAAICASCWSRCALFPVRLADNASSVKIGQRPSLTSWRCANSVRIGSNVFIGSKVFVSALFPSKQCTSSGNPEGLARHGRYRSRGS